MNQIQVLLDITEWSRRRQRPAVRPLYFSLLLHNTTVDAFFKGNIQLIIDFMMALAEEQIKTAFEQAEKEVTIFTRVSVKACEKRRIMAHG